MHRLVAFLRAINVGGHNVKMDALRGHFEELGLLNVETFIASGNVIFSSRSRRIDSLETRIEDHLRAELGYDVSTFVRTVTELAALGAYTPFSEKKIDSAGALNIGLLKAPLSADQLDKLDGMKTAIDRFHAHDRSVYWLCETKQSESKFSNVAFERVLGIRSTFRNVRTISRLAAKYPPDTQ